MSSLTESPWYLLRTIGGETIGLRRTVELPAPWTGGIAGRCMLREHARQSPCPNSDESPPHDGIVAFFFLLRLIH